MISVRTSQRRGGDRPTEDRIFTTDNAVVVLDGAAQPDETERNGGWLADTLGREICEQLKTGGGLAQILAGSIAAVADRYALVPGEGPSTTVSIVRWSEGDVDVLVLGDSPVVATAHGGRVLTVRDDRLRQVAVQERERLHNDTARRRSVRRRHMAELVGTERRWRNRSGGYWIAEALPEAASQAIHATWHRRDLAVVLVMTDGAAACVDRYGTPPDWATACALAAHDPAALIDLAQAAEDSDPDGERWPRSKQHDDKSVAVLRFCGQPAAGLPDHVTSG